MYFWLPGNESQRKGPAFNFVVFLSSASSNSPDIKIASSVLRDQVKGSMVLEFRV